jgi:hypothetical protein
MKLLNFQDCVIVGIFNKLEDGLVRTRTMEVGKKVRRRGS